MFYKSLISFLVGVLLKTGCFGQLPTYKVVDEATKQPISYASIKILNKPLGVLTDSDGNFSLSINLNDTVLISCAGYYLKKIAVIELKKIIMLNAKIKELDSITVRNKGEWISFVVGNGAKSLKKKLLRGSTMNFGPSDAKSEHAERILFPDSFKTYKISKIYIPVQKVNCWGEILIHVYTEDTLGLPGEEVFMKMIEVSNEHIKNGKLIIETANEGLYFDNATAFFVAVSWPENSQKKSCITTLLFPEGETDIIYERSLSDSKFQWRRSLIKGIQTHYSVELQFRK